MAFASSQARTNVDLEPPSFSLGLDETQIPSFSLGLDDPDPVTEDPLKDVVIEDSEPEDMPRRGFKRLRRGPKESSSSEPVSSSKVPSSTGPSPGSSGPLPRSNGCSSAGPSLRSAPNFGSSMETAIELDDMEDDIEEFTSDDDDPRSHSQKQNPKSFSQLNFVPAPPPSQRTNPSPRSNVSVKKSSLGSKEVKLQQGAGPSSSFNRPSSNSGFDRPVYEFRDNGIYVEDATLPAEPEPNPTSTQDSQVAALLRQRLPHFSFIDDLQAEVEPVYIDYRGQFGSSSARGTGSRATATSSDGWRTVEKPAPRGRKPRGRPRTQPDVGATQQAVGNGRAGYWLTEGGAKVYVSVDGRRLAGQAGYKQYLKDTGKLKRPRKSKRTKQPKAQQKRKRS